MVETLVKSSGGDGVLSLCVQYVMSALVVDFSVLCDPMVMMSLDGWTRDHHRNCNKHERR